MAAAAATPTSRLQARRSPCPATSPPAEGRKTPARASPPLWPISRRQRGRGGCACGGRGGVRVAAATGDWRRRRPITASLGAAPGRSPAAAGRGSPEARRGAVPAGPAMLGRSPFLPPQPPQGWDRSARRVSAGAGRWLCPSGALGHSSPCSPT